MVCFERICGLRALGVLYQTFSLFSHVLNIIKIVKIE